MSASVVLASHGRQPVESKSVKSVKVKATKAVKNSKKSKKPKNEKKKLKPKKSKSQKIAELENQLLDTKASDVEERRRILAEIDALTPKKGKKLVLKN